MRTENIIRQTTGQTITRRPINHRWAKDNITFEYSADCKEIEIYIGGYFLSSVETKNISDKAGDYLFT